MTKKQAPETVAPKRHYRRKPTTADPEERRSITAYLPFGVLRRAKLAAIDHNTTLSMIVEEALIAYLDRLAPPPK